MPHKKKDTVTAILVGDACTPEKSASIVDRYKVCPYCSSFYNSGKNVLGLFTIPKENKWWLNWVAELPAETMGLKSAAVFYTGKVKANCSWLKGELVPTQQKSPCGAQCWECSKYLGECKGCPATLYFLSSPNT